MTVTKRSIASNGVVYDWVRDDGTSGHILVEEDTRTAYPCDKSGRVIGEMSVNAHKGNVINPDPELKARFLVAAAAIFREWEISGDLPDLVSRNYG